MGKKFRFRRIVGDPDQPLPLEQLPDYLLSEFPPLDRIECGEGLIREEQAGSGDQGPGQGDSPPLPTRESGGRR